MFHRESFECYVKVDIVMEDKRNSSINMVHLSSLLKQIQLKWVTQFFNHPNI